MRSPQPFLWRKVKPEGLCFGRRRARVTTGIARTLCLLAMLAQEAVQRLLLANRELARLDAGMVHPEQRVDVVHGLRADVCELLDLGSSVLDLYGFMSALFG